jgi:CheY-like chemotaxis protein
MPPPDATRSSEPKHLRDRRLAGDEEQQLLASLKASGTYFAPLAELALETAMRQAELLSLTPGNVDLQRGLAHVRESDGTGARTVPLSPRAMKTISALPKPVSLVAPLFPISRDELIRVFRRACNDAGIRDLKFQDLRHEAISRISERMPMQETMRIVGYKTPAMLMRYYAASAQVPSSPNPELPALAAKRTVRILVVEDNRDAAHMLAQFLRLSGYDVTVAYSSREGLEAARKTPPDVVLCDIGLPDGDGYGLAQALRGNPQTAGARLIAVTARNREEDKQRSRDAGFQLHLVKPVRPESLLRELGKPARKVQSNGG